MKKTYFVFITIVFDGPVYETIGVLCMTYSSLALAGFHTALNLATIFLFNEVSYWGCLLAAPSLSGCLVCLSSLRLQ